MVANRTKPTASKILDPEDDIPRLYARTLRPLDEEARDAPRSRFGLANAGSLVRAKLNIDGTKTDAFALASSQNLIRNYEANMGRSLSFEGGSISVKGTGSDRGFGFGNMYPNPTREEPEGWLNPHCSTKFARIALLNARAQARFETPIFVKLLAWANTGSGVMRIRDGICARRGMQLLRQDGPRQREGEDRAATFQLLWRAAQVGLRYKDSHHCRNIVVSTDAHGTRRLEFTDEEAVRPGMPYPLALEDVRESNARGYERTPKGMEILLGARLDRGALKKIISKKGMDRVVEEVFRVHKLHQKALQDTILRLQYPSASSAHAAEKMWRDKIEPTIGFDQAMALVEAGAGPQRVTLSSDGTQLCFRPAIHTFLPLADLPNLEISAAVALCYQPLPDFVDPPPIETEDSLYADIQSTIIEAATRQTATQLAGDQAPQTRVWMQNPKAYAGPNPVVFEDRGLGLKFTVEPNAGLECIMKPTDTTTVSPLVVPEGEDPRRIYEHHCRVPRIYDLNRFAYSVFAVLTAIESGDLDPPQSPIEVSVEARPGHPVQ